jgi:hypothetical protein
MKFKKIIPTAYKTILAKKKLERIEVEGKVGA